MLHHGRTPASATVAPMVHVRIVHLSDTHNLHDEIEQRFGPLPAADLLIHTGDFTNDGTDDELRAFDAWVATVKDRYDHVVAIPGNHEWRTALGLLANRQLDAAAVNSGEYLAERLPNVPLLMHAGLTVKGLRVFGSAWDPWQCSADPDRAVADQHTPGKALTAAVVGRGKAWQAFVSAQYKASRSAGDECGDDSAADDDVSADAGTLMHVAHRTGAIPEGTDVLLTHGPARGIFDEVEGSGTAWGSSAVIAKRIRDRRVACHLFGHMHEQRGVWARASTEDAYTGGVEYRRAPGEAPLSTFAPPPAGDAYPCRLISCNAQLNHQGFEGAPTRHLSGPPRLIVASRPAADPNAPWSFCVVPKF